LPHLAEAASNATGVLEGRSPISCSNGSDPFTTLFVQLHLAVLGDDRHRGPFAAHIDTDADRRCRVSPPKLGIFHPNVRLAG
jgi:hypothetical protein